MSYPQNLDELKKQGYKFKNYGPCRHCNEEMEWWENPFGKNIPFNLMDKPEDKAVHHRQTCSQQEKPEPKKHHNGSGKKTPFKRPQPKSR